MSEPAAAPHHSEHLTPDQALVLIGSLRTELDTAHAKMETSAMKLRLAHGQRLVAEAALARSEASLAQVRSNIAGVLAGQADRDEEIRLADLIVAADPYGDQTGYADALIALMEFRQSRNARQGSTVQDNSSELTPSSSVASQDDR